MEKFIFNIGIVLFIFTIKFLISSRRKFKPDWEKSITRYERPILVSTIICYVMGIVLGNQIVAVLSLLPLVWLIVIELRVITKKLKG
ncbi:MAG: hypothetical protein AAF348_19175, partial [Bacteroidota bacterium]